MDELLNPDEYVPRCTLMVVHHVQNNNKPTHPVGAIYDMCMEEQYMIMQFLLVFARSSMDEQLLLTKN